MLLDERKQVDHIFTFGDPLNECIHKMIHLPAVEFFGSGAHYLFQESSQRGMGSCHFSIVFLFVARAKSEADLLVRVG